MRLMTPPRSSSAASALRVAGLARFRSPPHAYPPPFFPEQEMPVCRKEPLWLPCGDPHFRFCSDSSHKLVRMCA